MRLIDADELIKNRAENDPVVIAAICAPTAYDVDKVVGQMEEHIKESANVDYNRAMIETIEILKSGCCQEKGDTDNE